MSPGLYTVGAVVVGAVVVGAVVVGAVVVGAVVVGAVVVGVAVVAAAVARRFDRRRFDRRRGWLARVRPLLLALAAIVASATAVLGAAGCAGEEADLCGPPRSRVKRAIDGDTIELEGGERVRYLLIDTPESTGVLECFGREAAAFNADLVEGAEVDLAYDRVCRDDYGRLLAYVAIRGRELNPLLVERGFACALYIPPNGTGRRAEFETLETQARAAERGMWGACPEAPCR